jgi:hypothetical protein
MNDVAALIDRAREIAAEGERITREVYLPLAERLRDEALRPLAQLTTEYHEIEVAVSKAGANISGTKPPGSTVAFGLLASNTGHRPPTVQLPDVDDATPIWGADPGGTPRPEPTRL